MALDWDHDTRVLLYVAEDGTFAQLPALTRAFAALLLKYFDRRTGALVHGAEDAVAVICRRVGAHVGERRQIRQILPALLADGYLVAYPGALVIKNYVEAQNPRADAAARRAALREELDAQLRKARAAAEAAAEIASQERPRREPSASRARTEHESSASRARVEHEPSTKTEPTPRNDTTQVVPSVPFRSLETERDGATSRATPAPAPAADELLDALRRGSDGKLGGMCSATTLAELARIARSAKPAPLTAADFERVGRGYAAKRCLAWCRTPPSVDLLVREDGRHLFGALHDLAAGAPPPARPKPAVPDYMRTNYVVDGAAARKAASGE